MVYKSGQIFLPFCHNPRVWRTDRRTDRQTDRQNSPRYTASALHASRWKWMERPQDSDNRPTEQHNNNKRYDSCWTKREKETTTKCTTSRVKEQNWYGTIFRSRLPLKEANVGDLSILLVKALRTQLCSNISMSHIGLCNVSKRKYNTRFTGYRLFCFQGRHNIRGSIATVLITESGD